MNDDVAGLVERLEASPLCIPGNLVDNAASTIRALVAEIERLQWHLEHADYVIGRLNGGAELQAIMAAHNDTLAKLREAVEVMRTVDAMIFNDNGDVTYSPLQIRSAIRAFIATMEKQP